MLSIGAGLGANESTEEYYYVKGVIKDNPDPTWGNMTIVDDEGNELYVYGLYDSLANRYDKMYPQPKAGDTVILYSKIVNYSSADQTVSKIELKNAELVKLN